jgi:hypothetical protein
MMSGTHALQTSVCHCYRQQPYVDPCFYCRIRYIEWLLVPLALRSHCVRPLSIASNLFPSLNAYYSYHRAWSASAQSARHQ